MPIRLALFLLPMTALAACTSEPEPGSTGGAEATAIADPIAPTDAMPAEEPTVAASEIAGEPIAAAFPAALRGRWGLAPADCEAGRTDNKGLMTVGERTIRFYESLATLGAVEERSPTRLRATFAYEGEGMQWTRDLVLDAQGPNLMVLREFGEGAPPAPRTYRKCP